MTSDAYVFWSLVVVGIVGDKEYFVCQCKMLVMLGQHNVNMQVPLQACLGRNQTGTSLAI